MEPPWKSKTDPERYPVKFLADLWQKLLTSNFGIPAGPLTSKECGQFKSLRKFLGDWTQFVVEWMMVPKQWNHFTARIRMEVPKIQIPMVPHLGFLLQQRTRALKIMREYLRDSTSPADIRFVQEQDLIQRKNLLEAKLLLSGDKPEVLAKITVAKTLVEMQMVLSEILGGS